MTTAAILLPLLAWSMQRDPEAQAWAEAQAEMNALVPRLLAEVEAVRGELLTNQAAEGVLFASPLNASGQASSLPQKATAVALESLMQSSAPEEWYSEGLRQLSNPEASLTAFENAADLVPEQEKGLAVLIDLKRAEILQRLQRTEEALVLLTPWIPQVDDAWTLRDLPVGLLLGHRIADGFLLLGKNRQAESIYQDLQEKLLFGTWPLAESEVHDQLQFLTSVDHDELAEQQLNLRKWFALIPSHPQAPGKRLEDDVILLVDHDVGRVVLVKATTIHPSLMQRLNSLLPLERRFVLSKLPLRELDTALPNTQIDASSLMLSNLQLHLDDLSSFVNPLRQRQILVFAVVLILAIGLLGLSWFGRRLLLREESLQRTRTEFLAGVSHELRTPAASLSMLADNLLHGRVKGEERVQEYYRSMRRDARRLERLVADVLDVTRMDRGSFSIDRQNCDLAPVLHGLIEEQSPRLADAGIALTYDIADHLPHLSLDAFAVERACANLIENARRYASAGKSIHLSAGPTQSGSIMVRISDCGPGIPETWKERIFEAYERLPQDQTLAAGAGLGLALVKAVMLAHDGKVWVEQGAENIGACFVLEFPAHA